MPDEELLKQLESIPDELMFKIATMAPWQFSSTTNTYAEPEDIFLTSKDIDGYDREKLQKECWRKFHDNPQINTSIRGQIGRITGFGFETTSEIKEIQEVIDEIYYDYRNRLYDNWSKYVGRRYVEGELFICVTCREDGFIEVDFLDPSTIGDEIIYHPFKSNMALVYPIKPEDSNDSVQIPSIYVAYDPELIKSAIKDQNYSSSQIEFAKSDKAVFKEIGGFYRFIIHWDNSLLAKRNTSHLRTVLKWINIYEQLKFYEVDHKKSAGAFLWVSQFEDWKAYRLFLAMTDEEKQKTGLGGKYTPGSRLFLPPGIKLEAVNPKLPNITESDTDILHMITSGLNEPEDVSTGQSKGTFASVKASRGPMSDRTSDEVAYHDRFMKYDFWKPIFFLKSVISDFPSTFEVEQVVSFTNKKPKKEKVKKKPEQLIDISYPISETDDAEAKARAWLGVKHGSTNETLGISNKTIANKMGVQNYYKERLICETEKIRYPELLLTMDQETSQENRLEPKAPGNKTPVKPTKPSKPVKVEEE